MVDSLDYPWPNRQPAGHVKFFSLATGKKIKQQKMMAYPMPNLIIKKAEQLGKANAIPNAFDFLDRNGVLFELNNNSNNSPEGIVEENVVLYPFLATEIPGVVLD